MILITEFDLNPNSCLYTHFLDRAYTITNLRVFVKRYHEINTLSDHFQTIVIKMELINFEKGKGYWILNSGLFQNKEYIQDIKELWENLQTQQNDFRLISEWWEEGK